MTGLIFGSLTEQWHIIGEGNLAFAVFSSDGRWLTSIKEGSSLVVWDMFSNFSRQEYVLSSGNSPTAIQFIKDTSYLVIGRFGEDAEIWNVENGSIVANLAGPSERDSITAIASTPNLLVLGYNSGTIHFWELPSFFFLNSWTVVVDSRVNEISFGQTPTHMFERHSSIEPNYPADNAYQSWSLSQSPNIAPQSSWSFPVRTNTMEFDLVEDGSAGIMLMTTGFEAFSYEANYLFSSRYRYETNTSPRYLAVSDDGTKVLIGTDTEILIWAIGQPFPTPTSTVTMVPTDTITPTETSIPTDTPTLTQTPVSSSPAQLGEFVVLGSEGVWIRQNATVHSGHVGANQASSGPYLSEGSEVSIGIGADVLSPNSKVFGDTVTIRQNASVYDVYYNDLAGEGQILGQAVTPVTLPLVTALPAVPAFTPGTQNFDVASNTTQTLSAGNYGLLRARNQATVIFTGGVYHFTEWNVGDNAKIYFQAPTQIHIAGRLDVGQGSVVIPDPPMTNLDATDLLIYVNGQNGTSGNLNGTPDAAKFGINSRVVANVYAPNGTVWLRDGSDATGAFVGRWVIVGIGVEVTLESAFGGGQ